LTFIWLSHSVLLVAGVAGQNGVSFLMVVELYTYQGC